jgi:hypothetical protein
MYIILHTRPNFYRSFWYLDLGTASFASAKTPGDLEADQTGGNYKDDAEYDDDTSFMIGPVAFGELMCAFAELEGRSGGHAEN